MKLVAILCKLCPQFVTTKEISMIKCFTDFFHHFFQIYLCFFSLMIDIEFDICDLRSVLDENIDFEINHSIANIVIIMKDKRNDIFCLALQSLEFSIIYHDILDDMESPDIDNHYRPSLGVVGQIQSGSRESYSSNASDHSTTKVQRERDQREKEREITEREREVGGQREKG